MSKRKTRKASWLLTVASAYSVLPGCADDPSPAKPDANMEVYDAGSTVSPARPTDAAATKDSGRDAAGSDGGDTGVSDGGDTGVSDEVDSGFELDFPALIGVIVFPPGNEELPDGGITDPGQNEAAGDAGDLIIGLVALPPDSSKTPSA